MLGCCISTAYRQLRMTVRKWHQASMLAQSAGTGDCWIRLRRFSREIGAGGFVLGTICMGTMFYVGLPCVTFACPA